VNATSQKQDLFAMSGISVSMASEAAR